ncbi:hypothetical protein ACNKCJ_003469 [Cronobacter dublinensis]|uniref:hypothetical protein n=1 Tax=Cronobacter dublinensis TaxID=413497 RepID=UPI0005197215|nr:hypothetical protein [Cronobacter dublinensis]ALB65005.1 hypothetical protein AFK67_00250 [Cronobacter dublinensis subsp. dublinensis LMG 23823]EGT4381286.1 hypothetical protein [Cronobacter dublinensis]EKM6457274.1 hypothetical protein [Cronobacter dublinensis]EKY3204457.1 hypothetical protein [Cronobacter dublinensis]ELQ6159788.1 hypothetical protein [Cronobacter dublinensis]
MNVLLKAVKGYALLVITIFILGWLFIGFVASGSNETTTYSESDVFKYHTLTDKDIENAPRITNNYHFEAHPGDGYAPSNSIIFKGVSEVAPLRAYLEQLGYTKEKRHLGDKEIWSKPGHPEGDLFYLYFNTVTKEAELTKVLNN